MKKMVNSEQALQAVIFTESFDAKFGPLTLSRPKILMPLANRPILSYTLDMLAHSNISETFIFCNQHAQLIKEFIKDYQENLSSKMNIQVFVSEEYTNMGAAIRDLDAKGVIKTNFVLLSGDCVGNLQLNELIEIHNQNIKNDPGCVMTSVFCKAHTKHRIRSADNQPVILLDSKKKILFYENIHNNKSVEIPLKLLEENVADVHFDLIDTHISICSDKVPPDFSDNFDFENRDDFINGLLADDELLRHYIYAHILEDGYATRVSNIHTYDCISRDVIQRFDYPIVPDLEYDCSYRRNNVYLHENVNIMSKTTIKRNVAIGRNTSIGSESIISDSIIGPNCKIGNNVQIIDSYIWNNVTIEDNCLIVKSIIASNVTIRQKSVIPKGCVISNNVVVDSGKSLNEGTCLINDTDTITNKDAVGDNGSGDFFQNENDDSDDENEEIDLWENKTKEIDEEVASIISTNFSDSSDDRCDSPIYDEYNYFFNEVYESLQRGIEEKVIAENLILEVNSSKHAYNVPMNEVNSLVVKAILKLIQNDGDDFFETLKNHMKYMLLVIKNYIRCNNVDSQNDCIYTIEEFFLNNEETLKYIDFSKTIQFLYNENVLDEEVIFAWFYKPKSLPDHELEDQKQFRSQKQIILLINWLKEAEEESSDDDDEDEDDEEDEE